MQSKSSQKSDRQELAFGAGMSPPGGLPPRAADAEGPKRETLTQKFNRAADPRVQIELLQKKLSRPRSTFEMTPSGTITRSINPERDRRIAETIKAMSQVLSKKAQAAKELSVAARQINSTRERRMCIAYACR